MKTIIIMLKDRDIVLNTSLYDFVNELDWKASPIMVCNVTKEEYEEMKKQIRTGGVLQERYTYDTSYNRCRYLLTYDKTQDNLLVSDYDNPNKKGSYRIDKNKKIKYDSEGYQIQNHPIRSNFIPISIKVYTTETYYNIIRKY